VIKSTLHSRKTKCIINLVETTQALKALRKGIYTEQDHRNSLLCLTTKTSISFYNHYFDIFAVVSAVDKLAAVVVIAEHLSRDANDVPGARFTNC
jgi:hypothetical protein